MGFESDRELNIPTLSKEAVAMIVQFASADGDVAGSSEQMDVEAKLSTPSEPLSDMCAILNEPVDPLLIKLNKILCCLVQGSADPLSLVVPRVRKTMSDLMLRSVEAVNNNCCDEAVPKIDLSCLSTSLLSKYPDSRLLQAIFECESHSASIALLDEEVKGAALRESHGHRTKDAIAFENTDPLSIWSWDVNKLSVFSSDEVNIVKECSNKKRL